MVQLYIDWEQSLLMGYDEKVTLSLPVEMLSGSAFIKNSMEMP